MKDIAERLRARDWIPTYESEHASAMGPMCDEAAAEIERNRAAIAELLEALNYANLRVGFSRESDHVAWKENIESVITKHQQPTTEKD